VSLEDKSKLSSLIPAVDSSVSATTVSYTIIIERNAVELSLSVVGSKSSVLEELLRGIGWMPELKSSD